MNGEFDDRAFAEEFGDLLRRGLMEMAVGDEDGTADARFWPTAAGVAEVVADEIAPVGGVDPRD